MAHRLTVSLNYATHLPALMRALDRAGGAVLELGMGVFSTPYLHYACERAGRQLVSYETDAGWARLFTGEHGYEQPWHAIHVIDNWDAAAIDQPWGVALVDHSPYERRVVEVRRLAQLARLIVLHDSDDKWNPLHQYSTIYPLFAKRTEWTGDYRRAVVLSNFIDLGGFWK